MKTLIITKTTTEFISRSKFKGRSINNLTIRTSRVFACVIKNGKKLVNCGAVMKWGPGFNSNNAS